MNNRLKTIYKKIIQKLENLDSESDLRKKLSKFRYLIFLYCGAEYKAFIADIFNPYKEDKISEFLKKLKEEEIDPLKQELLEYLTEEEIVAIEKLYRGEVWETISKESNNQK
jgi:hypothetical protein